MSDTTDYSTWPTEEPPVGWEQFARNWMDTARQDAINADYWRRQTDQARRELDELRSLIPVLLERVQRGGPSNLLDVADKYMTEAQASRLRSLVGDTNTEENKMDDAELDEQASRMADQFMDVMQARGVTFVASARLEALEEIRQRVADGWTPLPADSALGSAPAWVHAHDWNEPEIPAEVAAVLWPGTEEET